MARILFAWKCGGGIGHLTRYSELIDQLVADRHEILFAARSLSSASKVFDGRAVILMQAPFRMEDLKGGVPAPRSYLHVLKNQGFADLDGLMGRFKAWSSLYEMWQPNLIVSDHSPTAVLAAQHWRGAKLVMSGGGFAVPPDQHPFQAFPIAPLHTRDTLLAEEDVFLEQHINPLMQAIGGTRYHRLCDAFRADARWLCLFREIDHYPHREAVNYLGTGYSTAGESPLWPTGQGSKVFAYLKHHDDLEELLAHLRQLGLPTLIKGDQLPDSIEQNFAGPSVKFASKMQDMTQVAEQCDLGITNGSASATAHFLLAGKPVLMMPMHIEQLMGAKAIERTGSGPAVDYLHTPHFSYAAAITQLTEPGNRYQRAAQDFATANKNYQASQLTRYMVADINRLLNS